MKIAKIRGKLFKWSCHDGGKTTIIDGNGKAKCPGTLFLLSPNFIQPKIKKEKRKINKVDGLPSAIDSNWVSFLP